MQTTAAPLPPRADASLHLTRDDVPTRQEYTGVVQTGVRIGGAIYTTTTQLTLVKKCLHRTSQGWMHEVETLDYVHDPTTELEELAGYLAKVRAQLVVEENASGQLVRVANKADLEAKWKSLYPELKRRYRASAEITPELLTTIGEVLRAEGQLERVLQQAPEYRLLFPVLFNQTYHLDAPQLGTVTIPRFLGTLDLPFRTQTWLTTLPATTGGNCMLQVVGEVDPDQYPFAGVRQAIRAITDRFDVDPALTVVYHETYDLEAMPSYRVLHAASHLRYEVPGVVGREVTAMLSTVTEQ